MVFSFPVAEERVRKRASRKTRWMSRGDVAGAVTGQVTLFDRS